MEDREVMKYSRINYAADVLYRIINSDILDEDLEEDLRDIAYYVEYGRWKD